MGNALQLVTSAQFLVTMAFIVAAFGIVLAGRNFELSSSVAKSVTANSTTTNGIIKTAVTSIEAAIAKFGVPMAMSANVFMIALAGIVPFMPTMPLFIAAACFGVIEGGILNVIGATLAAAFAANLSRAIVAATTTTKKQPPELMLVKSNSPIRRFLKAQMSAVKNGIVNEGVISQSFSVGGLRLLPTRRLRSSRTFSVLFEIFASVQSFSAPRSAPSLGPYSMPWSATAVKAYSNSPPPLLRVKVQTWPLSRVNESSTRYRTRISSFQKF